MVATPPPVSTAQVEVQQKIEQGAEQASVARRMWEVDAAVFASGAWKSSAWRVLGRRFITDTLSVGAEVRYWPGSSYPLSEDTQGTWAAGGSGQLYFVRTSHVGVYLGGSLLWVPSQGEANFVPEAGIKWFATQRVALGLSYWIVTDLASYTTSFEPPTGKSRQSFGLEFSFYL